MEIFDKARIRSTILIIWSLCIFSLRMNHFILENLNFFKREAEQFPQVGHALVINGSSNCLYTRIEHYL